MLTPLLLGVLLPGLVALVVALVGRRLASPDQAARVLAVAVIAGAAASLVALGGLPAVPARTVDEWLLPWLLGGLLVTLVARRSVAANALAALVLGAGIAATLVIPLVPHAVSTGEAVGVGAAIAASLAATIALVGALVGRADAAGAAAGLATWTGGAALAIFFGATVVGAQQVGAVAAAVGALAALVVWRPTRDAAAGLVPVSSVAVVGVAWMAHLYADLAALPLVLIIVAPLGVLAARLATTSGRLLRIAVPASAVLVLIGSAVGVSATRYFAEPPAAAAVDPGAASVADPDAANDYGYE